ncbi:hypothetical protein [Actinoplanes siamensis]|uniref:Uncharacterized protein n=1 Tax=Actinoplanes siamensis TaxID=1223317 RepID=A0A919TJD8_9ACTN|nr:hypothetical protein [Actinoplanes siamensis]GIF04687.1 hypothetical protein Asi03nite_22250 [Actinoplanes siamensis]
MFRYYVSYAFQGPMGVGMGALDWNTPQRICDMDDLKPIQQFLAEKKHANVTILGFSLYGSKKPNTEPNPQRGSAGTRAPRGR